MPLHEELLPIAKRTSCTNRAFRCIECWEAISSWLETRNIQFYESSVIAPNICELTCKVADRDAFPCYAVDGVFGCIESFCCLEKLGNVSCDWVVPFGVAGFDENCVDGEKLGETTNSTGGV